MQFIVIQGLGLLHCIFDILIYMNYDVIILHFTKHCKINCSDELVLIPVLSVLDTYWPEHIYFVHYLNPFHSEAAFLHSSFSTIYV